MKRAPELSTRDNARLHAAALRIARRCRDIVQGCLREEEWADADAEFCAVILAELRQMHWNADLMPSNRKKKRKVNENER